MIFSEDRSNDLRMFVHGNTDLREELSTLSDSCSSDVVFATLISVAPARNASRPQVESTHEPSDLGEDDQNPKLGPIRASGVVRLSRALLTGPPKTQPRPLPAAMKPLIEATSDAGVYFCNSNDVGALACSGL